MSIVFCLLAIPCFEMASSSSSGDGSKCHVAVLLLTDRSVQEVQRLLEALGDGIAGYFLSYGDPIDADRAYSRTLNALREVLPDELESRVGIFVCY